MPKFLLNFKWKIVEDSQKAQVKASYQMLVGGLHQLGPIIELSSNVWLVDSDFEFEEIMTLVDAVAEDFSKIDSAPYRLVLIEFPSITSSSVTHGFDHSLADAVKEWVTM